MVIGMWCNVYDDEGKVVRDPVSREVILLAEEGKRLRAFLQDVDAAMGVESDGVEEFGSVIRRLESIRESDPDRAPEAERFLNQAAALDADLFRHDKYIQKRLLPIDINVCLS